MRVLCFVNNSSQTLMRYWRLLYAKINPAFFTILINELQCTHSTKTDILQAKKKTRNGDNDHQFQTRAPQLLSFKKKKKQKSDSLVRVSRQRLQVPFYSTEINSTSETKARFKRGATAVPN